MLRGERVRLRPFEPGDAPTVWAWYRDHEFSVLDGNIYGTTLPAVEAFLRSLSSPSYTDVSLGIEHENGALIGLIRLKRGDPVDQHADFGIAIAHERWNQGYGTDATRTILRFAFDEMNLHRVSLGVVDFNARARRVYEKCGFVEEGRLREEHYRFGRWCDVIRMGILEHEWRAAQSG